MLEMPWWRRRFRLSMRIARKRQKHMGSRLDDFLKEEGIFEEAQAQAVKEVVAWQRS